MMDSPRGSAPPKPPLESERIQADSAGRETVLLVDDDKAFASRLAKGLERSGLPYHFVLAHSVDEGIRTAQVEQPVCAVVDLSIDPVTGPDSGLELIESLVEQDPTLRVIVLTGHYSDEFGLKAMERGAASFLDKAADVSHLGAFVKDGVAQTVLKRRYLAMLEGPAPYALPPVLVTKSAAMKKAVETIVYAASHNQPLMLLGETGTGKGLCAQAVHQLGARKQFPFLRYQPQFGSADLVSSELFGHQRGAFTGAIEARKGLIEEAHRGTLFIDEVGELPRESQIALLDVLQTKSFRRLGSNKEIASDFRLITATNLDPDVLVKKGQMRTDFYHRIAHLQVELPPLRERREDIPLLAESMLRSAATREKLVVTAFAPAAMSRLNRFSWPGNVRQLGAVVEGAAFHAHYQRRKIIEPVDLHLEKDAPLDALGTGTFRQRVQDFERRIVDEALQKCGGNQSEAARMLGVARNQLRRVLGRQ